MFDNGSEFKQGFTPLLKDFNIKPVLTSVKNPRTNALVERVQQVILNMIVTKDIENKVFDHIYPWSETLASIAWAIRTSYHFTIMGLFQYHMRKNNQRLSQLPVKGTQFEVHLL